MAKLVPLSESDEKRILTMQRMHESNRKFNVHKVYEIQNDNLFRRFKRKKVEIERETGQQCPTRDGFHGTPHARAIAAEGFDVSLCQWSLFGKGIYLAPESWKADRFAFGRDKGCPLHDNKFCSSCTRQMLFCLCLMGLSFEPTKSIKYVPRGFHSVVADPLNNPHIIPATQKLPAVIFAAVDGDQVLPCVLIEYNFAQDTIHAPLSRRSRRAVEAPCPEMIRDAFLGLVEASPRDAVSALRQSASSPEEPDQEVGCLYRVLIAPVRELFHGVDNQCSSCTIM